MCLRKIAPTAYNLFLDVEPVYFFYRRAPQRESAEERRVFNVSILSLRLSAFSLRRSALKDILRHSLSHDDKNKKGLNIFILK
jgi:hypothetical protein